MLQLWHRERFIICLRWSTLVISILIIDLQSSIDNKKVGARSQTTYSPWYGNQNICGDAVRMGQDGTTLSEQKYHHHEDLVPLPTSSTLFMQPTYCTWDDNLYGIHSVDFVSL